MLRIGWQRVDAKLVDRKFVERGSYNVHDPGGYEVWDYMVEVPDERGNPIRLVIREKSFKLRLPEAGGTVPVLVNRNRSKADFDLKDPRIDATAAREADEEGQRAADEARFQAELNE